MNLDPAPWKARAACRGMDPALFYPGPGETTAHARAVCAGCPVREECAAYALAGNEMYGIWGGLPRKQRRQQRQGVAA